MSWKLQKEVLGRDVAGQLRAQVPETEHTTLDMALNKLLMLAYSAASNRRYKILWVYGTNEIIP